MATHTQSSLLLRPALAYGDLRVRWGVARARAGGLDPDEAFRGLFISEAQVDTLMGYDVGDSLWVRRNGHAETWAQWDIALGQARETWLAQGDDPIGRLCRQFDLTPIEGELLLLALLPELDLRYERLCAYLQDDVTRKRPTADLLLNLLATSWAEKQQHRACLQPSSPLQAAQLLLFNSDNSATPLLSQFVRPAPSVVAALLGKPMLDAQLATCATLLPVPATVAGALLDDDTLTAVERMLADDGPRPLLTLIGRYGSGRRALAEYIAMQNETPLLVVESAELMADRDTLVPLLVRDARLANATVYFANWDAALNDGHADHLLLNALLAYPGIVVVGSQSWWQNRERTSGTPMHMLTLPTPNFTARQAIWQQLMPDSHLDLTPVATHFKFTAGEIRDAVATARDQERRSGAALTQAQLSAAARAHSNQKLSALASKIVPRYRWDDIVLPDDTLAQLHEMVNMVEQRPTVLEQWGFGQKNALGKGLYALFAGESGTGKTMAADIIAGALGLDLYRIDLSRLVSKYIGETEKNLDRIFHEAETSNAVLFFDEADAMFGKRSEVKDSHDRYANIEISYLLQRMESFDGIVILATNLRANLDDAFTRRIHFIIEFPFPEPEDRERIWRVNVPDIAPVADDVVWAALAERFRLAGGNIRNIMMAAAYLAATAGDPITMDHLLHATRREYQKIGRLINESLFDSDSAP